MISLRTSAQGNFHANTILPPLGHRREQFEVGNKISVPFRKSETLERLLFLVYLFSFFFFSLSRDQSKTARRGKEGEEILD